MSGGPHRLVDSRRGDPARIAETLRRVLARYDRLSDGAERVSGGLIHLTFRIGTPPEGVLVQRVNPIFAPEVHLDIDAVTSHLARRGVTTPRLLRTQQGELWVEDDGLWRVQTLLPGRTTEQVSTPRTAEMAGRSLGAFHRALADCDHVFVHRRRVHDIARHEVVLRSVLEGETHHRLWSRVAPVAEALLEQVETLEQRGDLPERVLHGDPKISNLLFWDGEATAWVDLDTVGRLDLPTELGDAFRSWCNPAGEDGTEPWLDLSLLDAALEGYAAGSGGLATEQEREQIVDGLRSVCLELGMRFAADALAESYFGWDPERFGSAGEHNLHRARVQLTLARSVRASQLEAERMVRTRLAA